MKKFLVAATVVAASLGISGGVAGAAPSPNSDAGALNMMHDPTMAPGTGGAMDTLTFTANHVNGGNAGMFHAVCVTTGLFC